LGKAAGRRTDFFDRPVLPHKCGVPPGPWNVAFMRQQRILSCAQSRRLRPFVAALVEHFVEKANSPPVKVIDG
jgi:hypothetical protein